MGDMRDEWDERGIEAFEVKKFRTPRTKKLRMKGKNRARKMMREKKYDYGFRRRKYQ